MQHSTEQFAKLCESIKLQKTVEEKILKLYREIRPETMPETLELLFSRDTWDDGLADLKKRLGDDPDGFKILTCMLAGALKTHEMYRKAGIPDDIFIDTIRCFPRFIEEHRVSFGYYGFDRDFWTSRQISMQLFRIDELEYELVNENNVRTVSLHIPSDAHIQPDKVRMSIRNAQNFLKNYFPDYQTAPIVCESWLLSPSLQKVLPPASNILHFQKFFKIDRVDWEARDVLEWVFKRADIPYENLPEDTTLQRNLKKFLLKGGKVGIGFGRLTFMAEADHRPE